MRAERLTVLARSGCVGRHIDLYAQRRSAKLLRHNVRCSRGSRVPLSPAGAVCGLLAPVVDFVKLIEQTGGLRGLQCRGDWRPLKGS
jgi:hypothetical protein